MGGICPKPRVNPDPSQLLFRAIKIIESWPIVETPAFVLMATSFIRASNQRKESASYYARALLIIAGLSDTCETLNDNQVTYEALSLMSRIWCKNSVTV